MVNSVLFTNNAYSTLTAAVTAVATTFSVASGEGARFPTIAGGDYFYATLIDTSNNLEIIKVTARSTDTFTITRAQEGTTAIAFAGGDRIELRLTAAGIDDRKDSTETLTNKTITSPDINGGTLDGAVIGGASAAAGTFTTIVANTSLALASGAVVTAILDEDAMGSDSATALATQQSIKAYVDAQVTASDLDFAGDSGTGAVDLDSQTFTLAGGNGITSVGGSQTITFNLDASNTTQTSLANLVTVGALNSGSISSGFGNIDIGSSTLSATGTITGPSGTWDSGGMDIAASDSYAVAGTAILSDAAGTMMLSNIDALDATTEATIEAAIDTLSNLTTVGALNSGSITSGFGNIDIGSSTFTTTGTLAAGATTLSGDLTVTGNFLYGAAATTTTFLNTSSDAADSGALQISGAGGVGDTRGSYFSLHGNEHANVGDIHYVAGTSGQHEFYNGSSVLSLAISSAGNFDFQDGTVTTTGTLTAGATTITGQGTVSADFGVGTTDILNSIGGVISPGVTGAEIAGSAVSLALDGTSSADFYMADSGAAADNKVVDLSFDGGVFSLRGINYANGVEDTAFSYTISTGAIDFTDTTLTTTGAAALGDTTITGTIGVTDSQGADLPLITATNTSAASYTQGFHAIFPNITAGPMAFYYCTQQGPPLSQAH